MTTKIYKEHRAYVLPKHIQWIKEQAKKSKISVSHLERILKDMAMEMDINKIINKYKK